MAKKIVHKLREIVGLANVLDEPEELACYTYDATPGIAPGLPDAVVRISRREEVASVVRACYEEGIPVIPRGAGTNLSGGTVPARGGVVLLLTGLHEILELDRENLTVTVEPGVVTAHLHQAVEAEGLFYPPDPASMAVSTLGGNVAECAGGLRGLKYGVTRDYVMGLEVVLPGGEVVRMGGKTMKNVSGYDLTRLFIGSEGTLGVFTEITLRLLPLPAHRHSILAVFDELEAAARAVSAIIAARVVPATLEIMDHTTINAVEAYSPAGLPKDAGAVLLIEMDGVREVVEQEAAVVTRVCRGEGARAVIAAGTAAERDRLWAARRTALSALARIKPYVYLEDATVPRSKVAEMVRAVSEIARRFDVLIGTFGHAGDGNLHPTVITDRRDTDEQRRADLAIGEIFAAALNLGGTLSGEHGIGLAKARYLSWEAGAEGVELMRRIKTAVDPQGLMNPGKIFSVRRSTQPGTAVSGGDGAA
jgi:glycolate oxidase